MGKENEKTFIQMILTFQKELSFLIYANVQQTYKTEHIRLYSMKGLRFFLL